MAAFTTERTARKTYKCSDCGRPIRPGERYRNTTVPPGGEFGYLGWSRFTAHLTFTACDYELAAVPYPDALDGPWEDQAIETPATAPREGDANG